MQTKRSQVKHKTRAAAVVAAAFLAAACGGGGGSSNDGNTTPPSNLASDCSSPVLTSVGTTFRFDYARSGASTGSSSTVGSVKRLTTFEGQADVAEVEADIAEESQSAGQPAVRQSTNLLSYVRRTANADTLFGSVLTVVTGADQGTVVRTVFSPPFADQRFTLTAGQRLTFTIAATVTTRLPSGQEQVNTNSEASTVTFIGQEQVTVPAGTFRSCRFDVSIGSAARPNSIWYHVGTGALLKLNSPVGTSGTLTSELQATSRLNGNPL